MDRTKIEDLDAMEQMGGSEQRDNSYLTNINNPQKKPDFRYDPDPSKYVALNCIDVANHMFYCPICSSYYKCHTNIYLIIIFTLIVICVLLLRKIIDMKI